MDYHYEASHSEFEAFYAEAVTGFTDILWDEFCECIASKDPLIYLLYPVFVHAKF